MDQKKIVVYTSPTCHYCKDLKEFLSNHNIMYEEKNVSGNETITKELVDISGQIGVPVTIVDGEILIGFDKKKISELLGIST